MTTEKLNGTVYEVHRFVVALPCGHNDTLEVRVREADPDKEDYLADQIAATEAGKNTALPVCRRCFEADPKGLTSRKAAPTSSAGSP
jgi:hypothetical protein